MATAAQRRPNTGAPTDGSRTITVRDAQPRPEDDHAGGTGPSSGEAHVVGALRLRGQPRRTRARVAWDEGVVDNEGAGKKKSKICCIYHKPRQFDESSSEESSDSDSDSDSNVGRRRRHCHHDHDHNHAHSNGSGSGGLAQRDGGSNVHELQDSDSDTNAYERAPNPKKGKT